MIQFPAGQGNIENGRTVPARLFGTASDGPAGRDAQELLDPGNIEAVTGQELSEAFQPPEFVV
jgi:hypothetical protein